MVQKINFTFKTWQKQRNNAPKYDPKLAIKGSFADVVKVSVTNPDKPKEKAVKNKK